MRKADPDRVCDDRYVGYESDTLKVRARDVVEGKLFSNHDVFVD